ncbi:cysteine desulfurase-like protein [Basidiobolus meristosporus CBS 931.73]|uniref:Cysteine desulfurase-like protein n=1 Tax=Basidiobolus meristosporus CBS 931.73 TaxID=1314790 RepID=A0A1Y1YCI9_9FUNG|nr:cysteine desulfurase-like protein [Basidiobolus meristosporus CBS 931.73]|eukprot:ORX95324.1 cysteine desulfurase-like protein [Basidiobolus meristosporus CBS 931.73]
MSTLNIKDVRKHFPALSGDFIYFENAGGSQVLEAVAQKIADYLLHTNVQLGATYPVSVASSERVNEGVRAAQLFMNAKEPSECIFGSSTTQLLANLSKAMSSTLKPGQEVIVTNTDHEANIGSFVRMAESHGLKVVYWKADPKTLLLSLDDLRALLNSNTRLVAVTHCSNILGTINDIKAIAELVHEIPGAEICVDGVAYSPHRRIDVQKFQVDYYAFSWYKVYGPHVSVLYARKSCMKELGALNHYFIPEDDYPYKFQPGNLNYELTYATSAVVEYFNRLGAEENVSAKIIPSNLDRAFQKVAAHEETLAKRLLDFLNSKESVRIIGLADSDPQLRVPTISFVVKGMDSDQVVSHVDNSQKIGIRWGHMYAKRLVEDLLGLVGGVVRVSMVHYNTVEEVDQLIRVLDEIL